MNIVFLDIDGVLNTEKTCIFYDNETIIEDNKLLLLKKLVAETQSKIVLVSTKKDNWEKRDKNKQGLYGTYLDKKFSEYGLKIYDKTIDDGIHRGLGVLAWKTTHKINNLVILDDDESGYDALTRTFYLVKILSKNGLTEQDIEKAKRKLSKNSNIRNIRLKAQRHAYHNDKRVFCCHVNGKIETYLHLEKQG